MASVAISPFYFFVTIRTIAATRNTMSTTPTIHQIHIAPIMSFIMSLIGAPRYSVQAFFHSRI